MYSALTHEIAVKREHVTPTLIRVLYCIYYDESMQCSRINLHNSIHFKYSLYICLCHFAFTFPTRIIDYFEMHRSLMFFLQILSWPKTWDVY